MNKHFFGLLGTFVLMILLGVIGVFAINYFSENFGGSTDVPTKTQVAK